MAATASLTRPSAETRPSQRDFDVDSVRLDFPILARSVHDRPLVYLDSAATSHKPQSVINTITDFYSRFNANVHRGVHRLSEQATAAYEGARRKTQRFINAADPAEVIFVRGATEAVNLVAQTYGRQNVQAGDEIIVSTMEHHSNIVPWQMLCEQTGARLRVIPINDEGELLLDEYERLLGPKTKLVAVNHMSNALGTINPVAEIIELARERNVAVLVDGAQAAPHMTVDVQALDCDFYVFSGHKMYGPTGIGVLYGRRELLDAMPPYQTGGDMIQSVSFESVTFNELPYKFEAGTPNIAGAIGLGAAIDYLRQFNTDDLARHERDLLDYATETISSIPGVRIVGTARNKAAVLSFVLDGVHPHDLGTVLDREGVAVRTGHHCSQPVMERFGIAATTRISLGLYNTRDEIATAAAALYKVKEFFRC